ncbi:MAG: hypothetical protein ACLP50_12550 [Solirubrobacteraceae bacterium]
MRELARLGSGVCDLCRARGQLRYAFDAYATSRNPAHELERIVERNGGFHVRFALAVTVGALRWLGPVVVAGDAEAA